MIDKEHSMSIKWQCKILKISSLGVYCKPKGTSVEDIKIMHATNKIHLKYPFYGSGSIVEKTETFKSTSGA